MMGRYHQPFGAFRTPTWDRSMRTFLLTIIIIAAAAGGAFLTYGDQIMAMVSGTIPSQKITSATPRPAPALSPISRPSSLSGIGALGYIEPRSRILRVSHDAGPDGARIETLNVDTGDKIKKNDTIAIFSDYGRKLAKRDSIAKQIPQLEAQLRSERANLEYVDNDYRRIKNAQDSAISISAKEKAELEVRRSTAEIQSIHSQIDAARANLVLSEEELVQSRVVAPIDGTILAVHARAGERVGDTGIVEMADLDHLDVVAEIYERDIARVTAGQEAEITIPGIETPITGKVYDIGHMVQKNGLVDTDPLATRDLRVIPVRIELPPNGPETLKNMLKLQVSVRLK